MPMKSPTVRHRRLGRELRRLREASGLTPEAAAKQLGWSRPKVNRIENARTSASVTDVTDACDLYGADSATKAGLIQLCRDASQRGWWTAYSDVFAGSYVVLEAETTAIRTWEPLLIPGLLQTEEYAHELIGPVRPAPDDVELKRRVDARMARKITLLGSSAPSLHALIDEGALRRPVASAGVMRRQLDSLIDVADRPNVTIQVVPLTAGLHVGLDGAFSVLSFAEGDPDVGYTGCPGGDVYVEAIDQVRGLTLTFEHLAEMALPPDESAALIAAARRDHD
ncbi:helix-turn-helix domain-containing protein [Microbispora bryophytorum]|uniref:Helix-turn-helix domain-containing protein n=1 Tax=Microbispora bryophytorum subsp. camponoti TaxID=1677852 RepID=A0ABR8KZD6_9ACTN|nr:helix-turn-helix transcriptional regulator [Microbispora camponoti]MBD3141826.1 helix-turn-helix domain-containing protein [Microbispora camponoti]